MKTSRFSEEQIIRALRQHEAKEKTASEICRHIGVSEATFYKWKKQYGGMTIAELQRLKELERENVRLKRMVANLLLDKEVLEEVVKKL